MNKRINRTILLSLAAIVLTLSACVKGDFETPPIVVPTVNFKANWTIAKLKQSYLGLDSIKGDTIISGIIIGNDESGNIYKKFIIQDATGGIEVNIDRTSMYTEYRVGQRVFIKCKGMYIGDYNGLIQLGGNYNGGIGQLPSILVADHVFKDSLPGKAPEPSVLTIPSAVSPAVSAKISTLVKFENVEFVETGEEYCPQSVTSAINRTLKDDNGNTLIVRNSKYATFAGAKIPSGKGTVIGILSIFGSDYQLTLRDTSDVIGFKVVKTFFSEPFTTGLGGFTTQNITGDQVWAGSASYGATISGFAASANHANEDWLISPAIDLGDASSAILRFSHAINKGDLASVESDHTVWISKDYSSGAPSSATWEKLTVPGYPTGSNWTFVTSGDVIIPAAYLGQSNVKIAFKYLSSDSQSATWEIKGVKVTE
jgi:hypothetical protein